MRARDAAARAEYIPAGEAAAIEMRLFEEKFEENFDHRGARDPSRILKREINK